ncbi:Pyridoxal phosphate-dependent transferase protein [Dioscorea alata]|uniref:Pyridoxal phosphate-dependent transferase protein n=1 Tax=Dioscorea alata TaxID=55571 RepID=A0ACB7TVI7_DIOAL|nr:Pyridoxal phosphate-dependent transferase protein [Dioscorea alata]
MAGSQIHKVVFFFFFILISHTIVSAKIKLGWSRKAATEAEGVAIIYCSGHGQAYIDGDIVDGKPSCECNTCYAGDDCSIFLSNCTANAESGDPLFLKPYWEKHAADSAVVVAGWHRMSYSTTGKNYITTELERHIRMLHHGVGNAVTDDKFIVFGAGSTQLLYALVHALAASLNSSSPASVVASVPYYAPYRQQTEFFDSKLAEWRGVTSEWVNASKGSTNNFIEFVTSPNNPDGLLKKALLNGSLTINDHAYYWPHFTAISEPVDEDVMLFTTSKLTGHAGSRFGWALIKDEDVYNRTVRYMELNTEGTSRETQLRMLKLYKVILAELGGGKGDIFTFGYKTMRERWIKLNQVVSLSKRFSLQKLPTSQYCNYFNTTRDPSPAYGWLKCEMEEDEDCDAVLRAGGLSGRSGTIYSEDKKHVRVSLIKSQDDFNQLITKLTALVNQTKTTALN